MLLGSYQLDLATRCYFTAVPFSPPQRTTKSALVKAFKHKANPATNEVRVENRNHGLA